jgi:hypothetical protein
MRSSTTNGKATTNDKAQPRERLTHAKQLLHDFWSEKSCGEALVLTGDSAAAYERQRQLRYVLEPFIPPFADFPRWAGWQVLEIGVGLGADHQSFAAAHAKLYGIDLTERAVEHTRARLAKFGLSSSRRGCRGLALSGRPLRPRLLVGRVAPLSGYRARSERGLESAAPGRDGEAHDLSHVERRRPDAVAALRPAFRAPAAAAGGHLFTTPGEPGHQDLDRSRGQGLCSKFPDDDQHGAHTRRPARLRGGPAPPRSGAECGAAHLAAPTDPALVPQQRFVHADHGRQMSQR